MKIEDLESLTHVMCMGEGEEGGGEMERDVWENMGRNGIDKGR